MFGFEVIRGHTIYRPLIRKHNPVIIDAGANHGEFGDKFTAEQALVIAIEPNVELKPSEITAPDNLKWICAALSDNIGKTSFSLQENSEASSIVNPREIGSINVPTITLKYLFDKYSLSSVDILKLDIEGAEKFVLQHHNTQYLQQCVQISVEYHDFCGAITSVERNQFRKILGDIGFIEMKASLRTYGDVLYLNSAYLKYPPIFMYLMRPILPVIRKLQLILG